MKTLQEATEKICDLKGNVLALESVITALLSTLSPAQRRLAATHLALEQESAQAVLLGSAVSEVTVAAYGRDVQRLSARLR